MKNLIWAGAGLLIVIGIWLSQTVNERWTLLTLVAGGYLLASGLTGWSPVERLFIKLKIRKQGNDSLRNK